MDRRLSAILAADVVGYSRLIGADEVGTLAALKRHRAEVFEPKAAQYHGRIVKLMGDGALMEFASVVDAVTFAVEVQALMRERNSDVPEDRRINFRIGINLGDVIVEEDDLYGDGVNVAARLEGLAEAGGICLSRSARDQIRDKLDLNLEDMGEIEVKNIARPVRAFRINLDEKALALVTPIVPVSSPHRRRLRHLWTAAAALALMLTGGVVWWTAERPAVEPALRERMAYTLPENPSIAVLPFSNLSADASQDYFADGMSEDLITDLSKIGDLFVIARNSSFAYKGKPVKVRQVAEDLGVRYIVEGSVRRSGDQVRINAQLVDALTGHHLWADRYDGRLDDIFALQDNVVARIVNALEVKLLPEVAKSARDTETESAAAYDLFLRGWAYYQRNTPDDLVAALPFFKQAIAIDPNYARAHAALAATYWMAADEGESTGQQGVWVGRLIAELGLTYDDLRRKALMHLAEALRDPTPLAYHLSSGNLTRKGEHAAAVAEAQRAIDADPNNPLGHEALAKAHLYAGRPAQAIAAIRQAVRLDPNRAEHYARWLGIAQFNQGDYEAAVATFNDVLMQRPEDDTALIILTAAYGHLGQKERAKHHYSLLNKVREGWQKALDGMPPQFKAGVDYHLIGPYTQADVAYWPYARKSDRNRLRDGLAAAGVPAKTETGMSPVAVQGATTVAPADARALHEGGVKFVDVRGPELYRAGHVPGAISLPKAMSDGRSEFTQERFSLLIKPEDHVVIYCNGPRCALASLACAEAVKWGYTNVHYFRDGFPGWKAAGYPIELGENSDRLD